MSGGQIRDGNILSLFKKIHIKFISIPSRNSISSFFIKVYTVSDK